MGLIALLVTLSAAACGGGSQGGSSGADSASAVSAEPSAEFMGQHGNNSFARYGELAPAEEREAASHVLERNLRSRAAGDWSAQCATLTKAVVDEIEERARLLQIDEGCALDLKAEAEPVPKSVRADTLNGPIDVLRIDGNEAYALYHGKHGLDYAMPMKKEDGVWKVASEVTVRIP
ncbi:MAG TPA: hypothetical protein VHB53_12285 [Solirubrobacterales bacterium]|nr:hypothetical protein [Solirubrobacterales bacterium]